MEGLHEVYYRDICNRINKIAVNITGNAIAQPLSYHEALYQLLKVDITSMSYAELNAKYSKADLMAIAATRPDWPDHIESTRGRKSDKLKWIIANN